CGGRWGCGRRTGSRLPASGTPPDVELGSGLHTRAPAVSNQRPFITRRPGEARRRPRSRLAGWRRQVLGEHSAGEPAGPETESPDPPRSPEPFGDGHRHRHAAHAAARAQAALTAQLLLVGRYLHPGPRGPDADGPADARGERGVEREAVGRLEAEPAARGGPTSSGKGAPVCGHTPPGIR